MVEKRNRASGENVGGKEVIPVNFPQSNITFGPPNDLDESQCSPIPAYRGKILGGNLDGAEGVIVAWCPSEQDLKRLNEGALIYLSCIGGLPPHFISTDFQEAIKV